MTPADLMARLPSTTVFLVLSSIASLANGHALPRPTKTIEYRELNVVPYPFAATAAPDGLLLRRQLNTVCGYVGGDPSLPATCSAGSHCVVDAEHGAVGCCPDGGSCTQGVFTGCVDGDSDPQTELNPYVFTCRGGDSCYKNSFEGGFFQYGCGSTTGMETKVVATASGKSAIKLTSITAALTATATSLSEPTTLGTKRKTTTRSSTTKSSATKSTKTSSTASETTTGSETSETETASNTSDDEGASPTNSDDASASSSAASAPDTDGEDNGPKNTGAIIGGTISGVAALVAFVVLGIWLWRRKKGNTREGPGLKPTLQHVGAVPQNTHNFAPLPSVQEVDETPMRPPPPAPLAQRSLAPVREDGYPRPEPWEPPAAYGYGSGSGAAVGAGGQMEHDEMPLTREQEEFFHSYNQGLGRISEENPRPGTAISTPGTMSSPVSAYPGPRGGGGGPLWQQNRGPAWL
ncbi:hypothetical protein FZEAL_1967 [Fusarium zealandicum]|uniref:Uncharacterized protein n=1 Tax=Fusarium zealandicum TaxID=1053134 RepID=A0A8H4XP27_9HYPO|nr:hypothetical protein FZEAL_1967 [Fusarium zealandicum]